MLFAFLGSASSDQRRGGRHVSAFPQRLDLQVGHDTASCVQRDALLPLILTNAHAPPPPMGPTPSESHALPPAWASSTSPAAAQPAADAAPALDPTASAPVAAPPQPADHAAPSLPTATVHGQAAHDHGEHAMQHEGSKEEEDALCALERSSWELAKQAAKKAMARAERDPSGAAAAATVAARAYSLSVLSPLGRAASASSLAVAASWQAAMRAASFTGLPRPVRSSCDAGAAPPLQPLCPRSASLARVAMSPRRAMEGSGADVGAALSASMLSRRNQQLLHDALQLAPLAPAPAAADRMEACRSAVHRHWVPLFSH